MKFVLHVNIHLKPRLYAQFAPPYVAFVCQLIVFICYWTCSLNISQMFQFYFKEKFDVLSSRYRHMRKMQPHLVLFALFIYTIFKEDNTPVMCVHGPHLRG